MSKAYTQKIALLDRIQNVIAHLEVKLNDQVDLEKQARLLSSTIINDADQYGPNIDIICSLRDNIEAQCSAHILSDLLTDVIRNHETMNDYVKVDQNSKTVRIGKWKSYPARVKNGMEMTYSDLIAQLNQLISEVQEDERATKRKLRGASQLYNWVSRQGPNVTYNSLFRCKGKNGAESDCSDAVVQEIIDEMQNIYDINFRPVSNPQADHFIIALVMDPNTKQVTGVLTDSEDMGTVVQQFDTPMKSANVTGVTGVNGVNGVSTSIQNATRLPMAVLQPVAQPQVFKASVPVVDSTKNDIVAFASPLPVVTEADIHPSIPSVPATTSIASATANLMNPTPKNDVIVLGENVPKAPVMNTPLLPTTPPKIRVSRPGTPSAMSKNPVNDPNNIISDTLFNQIQNNILARRQNIGEDEDNDTENQSDNVFE